MEKLWLKEFRKEIINNYEGEVIEAVIIRSG